MFKNVETKIHLEEVIQLGCVEITKCMDILLIKEHDVVEDIQGRRVHKGELGTRVALWQVWQNAGQIRKIVEPQACLL